jgi:hypothetical protein
VTVTEERPASSESRVDVRASVRRVEWVRFFGVVIVAVILATVTMTTIRDLTNIFLPPDGVHYIGDADSLFGNGARPLRHPPIFPAMVALIRPLTGEEDSFLWAMTISLALLLVSLHTLLRRWLRFAPSLIGAVAGTLVPIVAELIGWGGGATLLGIVMLVFTLAAMETWIERGGKRGFLVGVCLGVTALTHAFPFGVAAVAIAVRALVLLVERRRLGSGWDPLGLKGMASVAVLAVPAFAFASTLYFGPSVALGTPRVTAAWEFLRWAFDDRLSLWLLAIAATVGIQLSRHRGMIVIATSLAAIVIAFPAVVRADPTYTNRIAYLVPIVLALGVGSLSDVGLRFLGRTRVGRPAALATVAVALATIALTAYLPRLERSVRYYNVWITRPDLPVFESLRDQEGSVATSWRMNDFSDGVLLSWYVEGLAKRPAFGPGDAFIASIPEQFEGGLDMQRVFAGMRGLENDVLQVAAAPLGSIADASVQVRSAGFNYPFLSVRSLAGSYPIQPESVTSRVDGDSLVWTFRDGRGRVVMERIASLDGHTLVLRYVLEDEHTVGDWAIEIEPISTIGSYVEPLGGAVSVESSGRQSLGGTISLRGEVLPFAVGAVGAEVKLRMDGPVQVLLVEAEHRSSVEIRVRVDAAAGAGEATSFEQMSLLDEHDISNVMVLRNTRWMPRFDLDPCYVRANESPRIVVYEVRIGACSAGPLG